MNIFSFQAGTDNASTGSKAVAGNILSGIASERSTDDETFFFSNLLCEEYLNQAEDHSIATSACEQFFPLARQCINEVRNYLRQSAILLGHL
jgi:hypothetical protein